MITSRTQEPQLLRIITGAVKACIDAHGPITHEWASSAAKRIGKQFSAAALERSQLGWRKIDSAPKDGTLILLLSAPQELDAGDNGIFNIPPKIHLGQWKADGTAWVDQRGRLGGECYTLDVTGVWLSGGGWFQPNEVTHWHPLPELPKQFPSYYRAECGCKFDWNGRLLGECKEHSTSGNPTTTSEKSETTRRNV